jgi:hypothetical protein
MRPLGDMMGFSQIDVTNGADLTPPMMNEMTNFGAEFVWHCHILSHEENDMMRTIALVLAPEAPSSLTAALTGNGRNRSVNLAWTDNSLSETSFTIQRATDAGFTTGVTTFSVGANTTTYTDVIGNTNQTYYYRVYASNTVGSMATGYQQTTADSGFSNTAGVNLPPADPSNVQATAIPFNTNSDRVTVTWTDNSDNENGFRIQWASDANFTIGVSTGTVNANATTFTTGNLPRNTSLYFRVQAFGGTGTSAWVNAAPFPIITP